jgi:hypothetical protein
MSQPDNRRAQKEVTVRPGNYLFACCVPVYADDDAPTPPTPLSTHKPQRTDFICVVSSDCVSICVYVGSGTWNGMHFYRPTLSIY